MFRQFQHSTRWTKIRRIKQQLFKPQYTFQERQVLCLQSPQFAKTFHTVLTSSRDEWRLSQYRSLSLSSAQESESISLKHPPEGRSVENIHETLLEEPEQIISTRDVLLQALAERTVQHVKDVIALVDGNNLNQVSGGDEFMQRSTQVARKQPLSSRWEGLLNREKRTYRLRQEYGENPCQTMSLEELWDDALSTANIPVAEPRIASHLERESQMDGEGMDNALESRMSPIFGLFIDETGHFEELDSFDDDASEESSLVSHVESPRTLIAQNEDDNEQGTMNILHVDALTRALALLCATTEQEWALLDSGPEGIESEEEEEDFEMDLEVDEENELNRDPLLENLRVAGDSEAKISDIRDLLRDANSERYVLTTTESNLLLAHLVTLTDAPIDLILDEVLQVYREMLILAKSGRVESGPDATTYRLLILTLSRRLMALGEAVEVSLEMMEMEELKVTSEAFLEGMKACYSRNDFVAASKMMDLALNADQRHFQPSVESYTLMLKMMMHQDLRDEALDLLKRVEESKCLSRNHEDKLLMSLCRWPRRSRRGDSIDVAPFLLRILDSLERRVANRQKPALYVWSTLIDQLSRSADSDSSLWASVDKALRTVLEAYPFSSLDTNLLRNCLQTSESTADAGLLANLIQKNVYKRSQSNNRDEVGPSPIPHQAFRKSLEICLRSGDVESATTILDSFNRISGSYPVGVQTQIHALALLCHARAGDAERAKEILFTMTTQKMQPSEDLFGAVLHSLATSGRHDDAHELFRLMESGEMDLAVTPGVSCYNSILLAHVRTRGWDDAIQVRETMKAQGIAINSQTIQGLVLAHNHKGGRPDVVSFLETLLGSKASIDESTFRLLVRVLLPQVDGNTEDMRKRVREIGETKPELRDASLNLIRSVRVAEIEQNRPSPKNRPSSEINPRIEEAWNSVLPHFLEFVHAISRE